MSCALKTNSVRVNSGRVVDIAILHDTMFSLKCFDGPKRAVRNLYAAHPPLISAKKLNHVVDAARASCGAVVNSQVLDANLDNGLLNPYSRSLARYPIGINERIGNRNNVAGNIRSVSHFKLPAMCVLIPGTLRATIRSTICIRADKKLIVVCGASGASCRWTRSCVARLALFQQNHRRIRCANVCYITHGNLVRAFCVSSSPGSYARLTSSLVKILRITTYSTNQGAMKRTVDGTRRGNNNESAVRSRASQRNMAVLGKRDLPGATAGFRSKEH